MKINAQKTISESDVRRLQVARQSKNKEFEVYFDSHSRNSLSLSIAKFLEPHLILNHERHFISEKISTVLYVMSEKQMKDIGVLVCKIADLVPIGIDGEIVESYKREIADIFQSDNFGEDKENG